MPFVIPPLRFSKHAEARRREFHLQKSEVIDMIHAAEVMTVSQGNVMARFDEWSIVFDPQSGIIITILRRQTERWEHK